MAPSNGAACVGVCKHTNQTKALSTTTNCSGVGCVRAAARVLSNNHAYPRDPNAIAGHLEHDNVSNAQPCANGGVKDASRATACNASTEGACWGAMPQHQSNNDFLERLRVALLCCVAYLRRQ